MHLSDDIASQKVIKLYTASINVHHLLYILKVNESWNVVKLTRQACSIDQVSLLNVQFLY